MVEVLVAAIIFTIAALGTFASIAAIRKPAAISERKLTAAYYGRQILEDLRSKVDARNFNPTTRQYNGGTDFSIGSHPLGTTTIDGTIYTANYNVTSVAGTNLFQVALDITWTEVP